MTTYAPGTVAMVSVRGGPLVRAFRDGDPAISGWSLSERVASSVWVDEDLVTDVRPLVVLDLEPGIVATLNDAERLMVPGQPNAIRLARLREQIEAQTRPPRIPEPLGLGAVVEDDEGRRWVRYPRHGGGTPWLWSDASENVKHLSAWSAINAVKVLSGGVS